jgi:copper chaperone CopZ/MFS family permease
MFATRRRIARNIFLGFSLLSLAGAGLAGLLFEAKPMDMVLLQLVFYGAWSCLFGARVGGHLGAMMEEDCCSDLDMGVLSSMGSMLGTLSAGLVGTALTGLGLATVPWWAVFAVFVTFALVHGLLGRFSPRRMERLPHVDKRGRVLGPDRRPLPLEQQPPRMPDRVAVLLAIAAAVALALTLAMAVMMGSDLGHPVMMAPMMYGMFGTMLGGMLGGWLAGLLDEHEGHPDHDNPVMVSAMALMAGMMGGMPSGMIGGMMAIMGQKAVALTVAGGLAIAGLSWFWVVRGRYRVARAEPLGFVPEAAPRPEGAAAVAVGEGPVGSTVLRVAGMTCDACRMRVTREVGAVAGVQAVDVDVEAGRVSVAWGEGFEGVEVVSRKIAHLGYVVERPE